MFVVGSSYWNIGIGHVKGEVSQDAPTVRPGQERLDGGHGYAVRDRLRKEQIHRKQAEADGAEWHEPEFDPVPGHALA